MLESTAILFTLTLGFGRIFNQPTTGPVLDATPKLQHLAIEFLKIPKDEADPQPFVVRIYRPAGTSAEIKVAIITAGTMTRGEDYVPPPPVVTIPKDKPHLDLNIFGIDDPDAEGVETIEVSAFRLLQ